MGHSFGILGKGGNAGLSGASAPRRMHIQSPFSLGQPVLKDGCASVSHKVVASRLRAVPLGQQCHWEARMDRAVLPTCLAQQRGLTYVRSHAQPVMRAAETAVAVAWEEIRWNRCTQVTELSQQGFLREPLPCPCSSPRTRVPGKDRL